MADRKYEHQEYPKVLYHATEAPRTVKDPGAQQALGAGWSETPVEAPVPTAAAPPSEKKPK